MCCPVPATCVRRFRKITCLCVLCVCGVGLGGGAVWV